VLPKKENNKKRKKSTLEKVFLDSTVDSIWVWSKKHSELQLQHYGNQKCIQEEELIFNDKTLPKLLLHLMLTPC
jgi:hypothetical protein